MTSQKKAILTILLSFLVGGVVGILLDQTLLRGSYRIFSSPSRYERFKSRLLEELDLNLSQRTELEKLIERRQQAFNDFRKDIQNQYLKMRETTRDSIRGVLSSTQLVKFEALVKEFDSDHKHEDKK